MILLALLLAVVVLFIMDRLGAPLWASFAVALLFFVVAVTAGPTDFDFDRGR